MVIQTDLCGELVKDDIVHSTTFPGCRVFCFVQVFVWIWSPTVGVILKMEAAGRASVFGNLINAALCTAA